MERWIILVSGLATFVTAVATFFIVLEMKRQRASMYLPDVSVLKEQFYLMEEQSGRLFIGGNEKLEELHHSSQLNLEVVNVGLGAAKDVLLEWQINTDDFLKIIKKYDVYDKSEITINDIFLKFDSDDSHLGKSSHIVRNQLKSQIAHILPISIQATPKWTNKISVPPVYLDLYVHFLYYAMYLRHHAESKAKAYHIEEPPPLGLTITYKDIGGNIHSAAFNLKPSMYIFTKEDMGKINRWMVGSLDVEKLSS